MKQICLAILFMFISVTAYADRLLTEVLSNEVQQKATFTYGVSPSSGVFAPFTVNANYSSGGGLTTLPWGFISNFSVDSGLFGHGGAILGYAQVTPTDSAGTYYGVEGRVDVNRPGTVGIGGFSFGALTGDSIGSMVYGHVARAGVEPGYTSGGVLVGLWAYASGADLNINAIFGRGTDVGDNAMVQFAGYVNSGSQAMAVSVNDVIDAVLFDIDGNPALTGFTFRLNDTGGGSAFKVFDSNNSTVFEVKSNGQVLKAGSFAEIFLNDGVTAQAIATGVTYTKLTGFTTNGYTSNCTADVANDKITITQTGMYAVASTLSASAGTNNITFRGAVFLGGVEQDRLHWGRKIAVQDDVGTTIVTGFINVTSVPIDLDLRIRHNSGAAVNFTPMYMNLNVKYIGLNQ